MMSKKKDKKSLIMNRDGERGDEINKERIDN